MPSFNSSFTGGGQKLILTDLEVDGTTLVVDETNNRIGIGTANPSSTLELEASSGDITIEIDNNASNSANLKIVSGAGNARADLVVDGNNHITMKGQRVGIVSTNPQKTLDVTGDGKFSTDLTVGADLDVDGVSNLDNTDIDGTLVVDGSNISLDSTSTLNIDCSNTTNGVTIATATSSVPISIGHSTSETTVNDNLTVTGDLTVNGTTTTINSTTLTVDDKVIVVASGAADSAAADGAGISVDGASATILYEHTGTQWEMNKPLAVTGSLSATTTAFVGTDLTIDGGDIVLGNGQHGTVSLEPTAHGAVGKNLVLTAGATTAGTTNNIAGGDVIIAGGQGKGSGAGGDIIFKTANAAGSGSSLNATATALTISDDLSATFVGDVVCAESKALKFGSNAILSDSSGTMTLSNVDALDATTEATIEAAIDTLSNLTTTGTIGTGVWQGTAVASAYLDTDTAHLSGAQTFTGTKTLNSFKGTGSVTVTDILDEDAMGTNSATALATQQSIKAYADTKSLVAGSSSIVTVGTIGTGTWQGTAVASAYLDTDTAHLSGVQTFSGAKTFSADATFSGDTNTFESANATDPLLIIKNTTNDADGARLRFVKDKGAAGAANDECGVIEFVGDDASQDQVQFAKIAAIVKVHTNGQEGGELIFEVASHDGESQPGLVISDGSLEDEIDVTIGSGAASLTTVAGVLSVTSGVALEEGSSLEIVTPLLPSTDHTSTGISAQMLAGGAIAAFQTVCIHTTTQEVVISDSNAIGTMPVIGIAPVAISDTNTGPILLQGFIRDDTWAWTTGSILYASETAGAMTHTAPTTSGALVQALGVALSPDVVYFNPSLTLVEVA